MMNHTLISNHTTPESNSTEPDYFTPINAFINVVIYFVNLFVIYLFYVKKRRLLSCPSNQLLFSFFIMDVLGGFSISLQVILHIFYDFFLLSPRLLVAYRVFGDLFNFFFRSSVVMHLCGITLDRYMSLFYALHYRRIITIKTAKRYIAVSWLLPLFVSLVQLCWLYRVIDDTVGNVDVSEIDTNYTFTTFLIFFALPMIFLGAAFIRMFLEIKRLLNCPPDMNLNNNNRRISAKQRRVIYLFSSMYGCFLILTLPYYLLRSYIDFVRGWDDIGQKYITGLNITYTLKNLTSITSPLLYTGINRDTRTLFIELCNTNLKKTRARLMEFLCYLNMKKKKDGSSDVGGNIEGSISSSHDICGRSMITKDTLIELVVLKREASETNELV